MTHDQDMEATTMNTTRRTVDTIAHETGRPADARTILAQMRGARMSLGVREVVDLGDGIKARVGIRRGQYLIVKLNALDLYDVEFATLNARSLTWRVKRQLRNIDAAQLADVLIRASDGVLS